MIQVVYLGTRDGRLDAQRGTELWCLLVKVRMNEVAPQARWNLVKKRSVTLETPATAAWDQQVLPSRQTSPDEAVLVELVEQLLRSLTPSRRRILEQRFPGHDLQASALETGCGHRTVCRALSEEKQRLGTDPVP